MSTLKVPMSSEYLRNKEQTYSRKVAINHGSCPDCEDFIQWKAAMDPTDMVWNGTCRCEDRHWRAKAETFRVSYEEY